MLKLPFGGLIYTRHDEEADQICDEVFGDSNGAHVLGFDIEWKVTYVTDEVRERPAQDPPSARALRPRTFSRPLPDGQRQLAGFAF